RICIAGSIGNFTGIITAQGGPGAMAGGAGTCLFTNNTAQQLLVDNGGLSGTNPPFASLPPAAVTISGGAIAALSIQSQPDLVSLTIASNSFLVLSNVSRQDLPTIQVAHNVNIQT